MSRTRGRPSRGYRIRVRTVRRDPIDYDALARAALEQAAMDQRRDQASDTKQPSAQRPRTKRRKGPDYDSLA